MFAWPRKRSAARPWRSPGIGGVTVQDRRSFLAALGAAAGSSVLAAAGLGCAPASQSAATGRRLRPIGVQLYTLRREMERNVEATLARVAQIGYREVEFAGYFNREPTALRMTLTANGLSAPSAHIPLEVLRDSLGPTIDAARVLGHEYIVMPYLEEKDRRTIDDYKRVAEIVNRAAESGQRAGIRLGYHNHDFEFVPLGRVLPYDVLLASLDPALVTMELDLYWITKAGYDPLTYFAKYPGRFQLVHLKDSSGPPDNRIVDVGRGVIDWKRIFAQRDQAGIRHYFVENDNPTDDFAAIETSYRYLSQLEV